MSSIDDIIEIKKDISSISVVVGRMDITIEKLTEVSSNVSKILAVQTEKVEQTIKTQDRLADVIERRREEVNKDFEEIYEQMSKDKDKIFDEIKKLREEQQKQHELINSKISNIEKMMWLYMGGFSVVVFIMTQLPNIFKFIGK
jgi:homoserine dehydrogenase